MGEAQVSTSLTSGSTVGSQATARTVDFGPEGGSTFRVTHVTVAYQAVGGIESQIAGYASALPQVEFEVVAASSPGLPAWERVLPNLVVCRFPPLRPDDRPTQARGPRLKHVGWACQEGQRLQQMMAHLRRTAPSILHLHHLPADHLLRAAGKVAPWLANAVLRALAGFHRLGRPVVLTYHGNLNWPPNSPECRVAQGLKEYGLHCADVCTAVERSSYLHFREQLPGARRCREVAFTPNAIDTRLFAPQAFPPLPPLRVGFVGRWDAVRGTDLLGEVLTHLPEGIRVDIAAGVHNTATFLSEAPACLRQESVKVRLNLRQEDMPAFYAAIHVLLNPVTVESISRATLEAMACARPAIMTAVGDRYPTIPGQTGYVVPDDPQAVLGLLQRLRGCGDELRASGERAHRLVSGEFDIQKAAQRMLGLYMAATALGPAL